MLSKLILNNKIMWATILRTLMTTFAGVGIGEVIDKIPNAPVQNPYKEDGGINWKRLLVIAACSAIAGILIKFIARKLKVRLPF